MRHEPSEFRLLGIAKSKRRPAGLVRPSCGGVKPAGELPAADILDEAFSEYSRIDAGMPASATPARAYGTSDNSTVDTLQPATRELVADIACQLEMLERQRDQLARLLQRVELGAIAT